jgi:hypothetical protein
MNHNLGIRFIGTFLSFLEMLSAVYAEISRHRATPLEELFWNALPNVAA